MGVGTQSCIGAPNVGQWENTFFSPSKPLTQMRQVQNHRAPQDEQTGRGLYNPGIIYRDLPHWTQLYVI